MIKNKIFIFIIVIFFFSIISANGLTSIPNQFTINKTQEITQTIQFNLTNTQPYNMINIKFENNPYIEMPLTNLSSGESKNIISNVIATDDFSGILRIKGFFESNLGQQNEVHQVDISYNNGIILSQCDFSIIKGDTVNWNNLINTSTGDVKLINADTNLEVTLISKGSSYSQVFDTPLNFRYYITRLGIPSETCKIAVLDTQGLINDPSLDAQLILDIKILFDPTTISSTILTESYTIEAGSLSQDILSVKNMGNNLAKNVHLESEWFTFNINNFDLNPGESRNVGYTITPIINETNQTDKTYIKKFSITGNFNTFEKDFSIFIPYKLIDESFFKDSKTLEELFKNYLDFIKAYCTENPNLKECSSFIGGSSSSSIIPLDPESQFKNGVIQGLDRSEQADNQIINTLGEFNSSIYFSNFSANETDFRSKKNSENIKSLGSAITFLTSVILFIIFVTIAIFVYRDIKLKKVKEDYSKYY
mgnify:FL=1